VRRAALCCRAAASVLVIAVLLGARRSAAETPDDASGSRGTFAFRVESFRPGIDTELGGDGAYARIFGDDRGWTFRLEGARTLSARFGAIDLGAGVGFFRASGKGLYVDAVTGALATSADETALNLLPLSVFAKYRYDLLARRHGVPLVPYAKLALERYVWWTTSDGGATRTGATDGYALTLGTALVLDVLDPRRALELEREVGIRDTALTIDVTKSVIDDFGSDRSWSLSDPRWTLGVGLLFTF
jgi:hypothetical protein